jgi:hypothetical protein
VTPRLLIVAAHALLVVTAAAVANAGNGHHAQASAAAPKQSLPNPARVCIDLRTSLTEAVFTTQYATFGKCVSQNTRAQSQTTASAESSCWAERDDTSFAAAHDGKTFAAHYGTNDNDANAFGKCVAQKAKARWGAQIEATLNAAKACWKERKADAAAFKLQWKVFGACVTAAAKG